MTEKMKEMTNDITLQGLLKNNTLELKTDRNGRRFVSGSLEVDTGNNGEECIVQADIFAYELKKDGTKSTLFDRAMNVLSFPSAATNGNDNAVSVTISRARIQDNSFWAERDSRIVEDWRPNAVFVDQATKMAPRINNFSIQGVIDSIKEDLDAEGNPTGELKIDLLNVGFNESIIRIPLYVVQQEGVKYVNSNWSVGDLITVHGTIEYKTTEIKREQEVAFGTPVARTYTKTSKRLVITSGMRAIPEDEHTYSRNKLLALNTAKLKDIEERAAVRRGAEASPTTVDPFMNF